MDLGKESVTAIVIICYLTAQVVKSSPLDNKWLPVICGIMGGFLGLAGMYISSDFPAHDVLDALAVGIVSGFAATGINQIYKQFTK